MKTPRINVEEEGTWSSRSVVPSRPTTTTTMMMRMMRMKRRENSRVIPSAHGDNSSLCFAAWESQSLASFRLHKKPRSHALIARLGIAWPRTTARNSACFSFFFTSTLSCTYTFRPSNHRAHCNYSVYVSRGGWANHFTTRKTSNVHQIAIFDRFSPISWPDTILKLKIVSLNRVDRLGLYKCVWNLPYMKKCAVLVELIKHRAADCSKLGSSPP